MTRKNLLSLLLTFAASSGVYAKEPVAVIEPAAKAILEESIKATGGREAMAKIKSRHLQGEIAIAAQGLKMGLDIKQKAPMKSLTKSSIPDLMSVEQGFDGEKGWSKDSVQGVRELAGLELDQIKESAAIFPELLIFDNLTSAKLLKDEEEEGKTHKVVEVKSKGAADRTLYFDKESKLLVKMLTTMATGPDGTMKVATIMSDYKEQDGVKYPAKMRVKLMGQDMVMTLTSVKHNVEIDDAIFAKPE